MPFLPALEASIERKMQSLACVAEHFTGSGSLYIGRKSSLLETRKTRQEANTWTFGSPFLTLLPYCLALRSQASESCDIKLESSGFCLALTAHLGTLGHSNLRLVRLSLFDTCFKIASEGCDRKVESRGFCLAPTVHFGTLCVCICSSWKQNEPSFWTARRALRIHVIPLCCALRCGCLTIDSRQPVLGGVYCLSIVQPQEWMLRSYPFPAGRVSLLPFGARHG